MIRGILFDFDGTLANSIDLIMAAFYHSGRVVLGRELSKEEIIKTFGLILPEAMAALADRPEQIDPLRDAYRAFNNEHHDAMIKPMPGAKEALAQLKAMGIKMAVVTSKKNPMCHRGLRCCHLEEYIDAVVAYGDTTYTKPHPEPMKVAASLLGLEPCDCLSVGDSPFDLISGREAGALTAAVAYTTYDWQKMLQEGKPDYVLETLDDLVTLVTRLNQQQLV